MNNKSLLQKFAKGKQPEQSVAGLLNAVVYTRVSSKEQADTNKSLEWQKKYCDEYAIKNNLPIAGYFGGTYESAQTDERLEFNRMITYVKNHKQKISFILVYSLDRFSRSGENAIFISSELKKIGIAIIAVTQPMDTNTHTGTLQQNIHFIFSKYDNDLRRQKCVDGMREKLRKGEWLGNCPLGYSYDKTSGSKEQKIVVNGNSALIRKAFLWRANDNVSHTAIAERLQEKGLKMDRKRLTEIFRNPFYCGFISHNILDGEIVKGKHEPIISEEIFLQVNNALKKNSQGYKWAKENPNIPLKHFVRCEFCSSPYAGYIVKKKKLYYYKCATTGCKCNRNAEVMHEKFQHYLNSFTVITKFIDPLIKQMQYTYSNLTEANSDEKQVLVKKLNEVKSKLFKVEERFACGEIEKEVYVNVSGKFRTEMDNFGKAIQSATQNFSNPDELINYTLEMVVKLGESWREGQLYQKTALQNLIFPIGIHYDRRIDAFRTNWAVNIFRRIHSFPVDYEKNKGGKLEWTSNYSASVARRGIEPLLPE
jgi:site-specific DNA recombinase